MSDLEEQRIAELEQEVASVQTILFGVLLEIGEPVSYTADDLRQVIAEGKYGMKFDLDQTTGIITCKVEKESEQ